MASKETTQKRLTQKDKLRSEYKRLAKAADRKLRELKKISEEQDFKDATNWAYAKAMQDIEHRWGEGETRFDKRLPKDWKMTSMIAAINEVKTFLASPTSSKRGIINVYKKRIETLKNARDESGELRYPGLNITWQQAAKLFENGTFDKLLSKYTSDETWIQVSKRMKRSKELMKAIKEADTKIVKDASEVSLYEQLVKLVNDGTIKLSEDIDPDEESIINELVDLHEKGVSSLSQSQQFEVVVEDLKRIANSKAKRSIKELSKK